MAVKYKWKRCPNCRAPIGGLHDLLCDIEICPHCGGQALLCSSFDLEDPRRMPWTGEWPGAAEAAALFGWSRWDPAGRQFVPCAASHPDALPELTRLPKECQWNAERQCWERTNPARG